MHVWTSTIGTGRVQTGENLSYTRKYISIAADYTRYISLVTDKLGVSSCGDVARLYLRLCLL